MEYLVMECTLHHAVVLDEEGRFLNVPNLGYEVGQILDSVITYPEPVQHRPMYRHVKQWIAVAACLCMVILGFWFWQTPMGTVRMQINPEIQMTVNRFRRFVGLKGLNEDGKALMEGYHFYGHPAQAVSDDLADRAVEMGYLQDGGQIALTVDSTHGDWKTAMEEMLLLELKVHLEDRAVVVTIPDKEEKEPPSSTPSPHTIIIDPSKVEPATGPSENDDPDDNDGQDDDREDIDDRNNTWGEDDSWNGDRKNSGSQDQPNDSDDDDAPDSDDEEAQSSDSDDEDLEDNSQNEDQEDDD